VRESGDTDSRAAGAPRANEGDTFRGTSYWQLVSEAIQSEIN
jgi:hypothetical protein